MSGLYLTVQERDNIRAALAARRQLAHPPPSPQPPMMDNPYGALAPPAAPTVGSFAMGGTIPSYASGGSIDDLESALEAIYASGGTPSDELLAQIAQAKQEQPAMPSYQAPPTYGPEPPTQWPTPPSQANQWQGPLSPEQDAEQTRLKAEAAGMPYSGIQAAPFDEQAAYEANHPARQPGHLWDLPGDLLSGSGWDAVGDVAGVMPDLGAAFQAPMTYGLNPLEGTLNYLGRGELPPSYSAAQQSGAAAYENLFNQEGSVPYAGPYLEAAGRMGANPATWAFGPQGVGAAIGGTEAQTAVAQLPGADTPLGQLEQGAAMLLGGGLGAHAPEGFGLLSDAARNAGYLEPEGGYPAAPGYRPLVGGGAPEGAEAAPFPQGRPLTPGGLGERLSGNGNERPPGAPPPEPPNAGGWEPPPQGPQDTLTAPGLGPPKANFLNLADAQPGLTVGERLGNFVRTLTRQQVVTDEQATPIMDQVPKGRAVSATQANRLRSMAATIEQQLHVTDDGLVQLRPGELRGVDTAAPLPDPAARLVAGVPLQDMAANLPEYEPYLSPRVVTGIRALGQEFADLKQTAIDTGRTDIGSRPDVVDGGVYLPRGRPVEDGIGEYEQPIRSSPGRRGAATGSEKAATYPSMQEAIANGETYPRPSRAVYDAARGLGDATVYQHAANQIQALTDVEGFPLGKSLSDEAVVAQRAELARQIRAVSNKLNTATKQAGINTAAGGALNKGLRLIEERVPTNSGQLAKLDALLRSENEAAGDFMAPKPGPDRVVTPGGPVRLSQLPGETPDVPATPTAIARGEGMGRVIDKVAAVTPDDVQVIRFLDKALDNAQQRATTLAAKGGAAAERAGALQSELQDLRSQVEALPPSRPGLQRGYGMTDLAPLQGQQFPQRIANAVNAPLRASEAPLGSATWMLNKAVSSVNVLGDIVSPVRLSANALTKLSPIRYGRAVETGIQGLFDKGVMGKVIAKWDATAEARGVPTTQEIAARMPGAFSSPGDIFQSRASLLGNLGTALRLQMIEAAWPALKRTVMEVNGERVPRFDMAGADGDAVFADAARATGVANVPGGNLTRGLIQFPQWTASQIAFIVKAAADGGLEGQLARESLGKMLGTWTLGAVAINEAQGKKTDWSGGIPTMWIGGQELTLPGAMATYAKALLKASPISPDSEHTWQQPDLMYLPRSKASPVVKVITDAIDGRSLGGVPFNGGRNPAYWAQLLAPFNLKGGATNLANRLPGADQGPFPQPSPLQQAEGTLGLYTKEPSPFLQRRTDLNDLARQMGGDWLDEKGQPKAYSALDPVQRRYTDAKVGAPNYDPNSLVSQSIAKEQADRDRAEQRHAERITTASEAYARDIGAAKTEADKGKAGAKFIQAMKDDAIASAEFRAGQPEFHSKSEDVQALNDYWGALSAHPNDPNQAAADFAALMESWTPATRAYVMASIGGAHVSQATLDAAQDPIAEAANQLSKLKNGGVAANLLTDQQAIADSGFWKAPSKERFLEAHDGSQGPVAQALARWGYAEPTRAALGEYEAHAAMQKAADHKLIANPADARLWRDDYHTIQDDLRSKLDAIYSPKDGRSVSDILAPNVDPKLDAYYKFIDSTKDPANNKPDWTAVDRYLAANPDVQKALDAREQRPPSVTVQAYRDAVKRIEATHYWDVQDALAEKLAATLHLPPTVDTYPELKDALTLLVVKPAMTQGMTANDASDLANVIVTKILAPLATQTSNVRDILRASNKPLVEDLRTWDYWQPGKKDLADIMSGKGLAVKLKRVK